MSIPVFYHANKWRGENPTSSNPLDIPEIPYIRCFCYWSFSRSRSPLHTNEPMREPLD